MRSLLRLLPYYGPHRRDVAWGMVMVVASSAIGSLPPWFLRTAIDDIRANAPVRQVFWLGAGIVGVALFGGIAALYFMLKIDTRLTLLALLPMVFLPVAAIVLGREIHRRFESVQAYFGDMTTMAQENLSGVRVVRAYRQERAETERFGA